MPELPEVEHVRRGIEDAALGRRVRRCVLHRADVCESFDIAGEPTPTTPRDLLEGATIARVTRLGKQIAIIANDSRTLCVHLGMTGQVLVERPGTHVHAEWELQSEPNCEPNCEPRSPATGRTPIASTRTKGVPPARSRSGIALFFRDPRRFGGLWTFPTFDALRAHRWNELGPDALTVTAAELAAECRSTTRSIKSVLLDQSSLAGVGNIYADESLFASAVHPLRKARTLTEAEVERLAAAIRAILSRSVAAGGSTLADSTYSGVAGDAGSFQAAHQVYARAGQPCLRCGRPLSRHTVAQRTTVACPTCQPRTRPAKAK